MTIAVGIVAHDGVLVAADAEESDGGIKVDRGKLNIGVRFAERAISCPDGRASMRAAIKAHVVPGSELMTDETQSHSGPGTSTKSSPSSRRAAAAITKIDAAADTTNVRATPKPPVKPKAKARKSDKPKARNVGAVYEYEQAPVLKAGKRKAAKKR